MATDLSSFSSARSQNSAPVDQQLHCALTGRPIGADEAYWAPPLITARLLITTIVGTALRTPSNLGYVLFAEQPDVPYAPDVQGQLAARRSAEQLKLLLGLLLALALILAPIAFIAMR